LVADVDEKDVEMRAVVKEEVMEDLLAFQL